tara:strand:+ start:984 stop:2438 length:1455 start_codon:yes stop_codon:yes gene_type:complete
MNTCGEYNNIQKFIIALNENLTNNCFISGTYIFEGDNLFRYLCDNTASPRIGQGRLFGMKPKSHNLHILNKLFIAHKLNAKENVKLVKHGDDYIDKNKKTYKSYKQYEINLDNCKIQYPCNSKVCQGGTPNIENYYQKDTDIYEDIDTYTDFEEQRSTENMNDEDKQRIETLDQLKTKLINTEEQKIYCELNKEIKKCCLFYRFHVQIENEVKTYTFLKLEISPTINVRDAFDHAVHAAKHYFTKNGSTRKNTWSIRREDYAVYSIINDGNEIYIDSFKPSKIKKCEYSTNECGKDPNKTLRFKPKLSKSPDRNTIYEINDKLNIPIGEIRLPYLENYKRQDSDLYTTLPLYSHFDQDNKIFGLYDSFKIYNDNVRTRNEMFIPLGFYEDLLQPSINGGAANLLTKTNKYFLYNDYNYTVYKNITSKQEFIKLNKIYTLCASLKKQTYRKLPQKITFNEQKHIVYETIKNNRRFILIDNRRKYI